MTAWGNAPLEAVCQVNIGRTPARNRPEFWGPGHAWLSIADMNQGHVLRTTKESITDAGVHDCNCRRVEAGTVLLSFKLSIGKVGIAEVPLFTNEAIAALPVLDPERLRTDYLFWALKSIDLTVGLDRAAKGLILNKAKIRDIEIPLPPIAEQRRIARVLDRAEALRTKRRVALGQLDELTDAVFLDLFGDPAANPRGFPTTSLKDILEMPLRNGLSPSNGGIVTAKVLTLSAVTGAEFNPNAWKTSTFHAPPPADQSVDDGDFLICRGNGNIRLVGRGHFPGNSMPDTTFPDTMIAARVAPERIERLFLEHLWNSTAVRQQLEAVARTTNGTFKVNQSMLESISLMRPPLSLQVEFGLRVANIVKLKSLHRASSRLLDTLFVAIQHRAFRGEL